MKIFFSILLLQFAYFPLYSQQSNSKILYKQAYTEQLQMLKGEKPIDFKRSVFITENAYYNGKLNYQSFCGEISVIGRQLKEMIRLRGIQGYKTAGNWATFTYMSDSLPINNFKPFRYDFDDFMGDKDWTKMFVTKLIKTHSGNCHSLPFYYKILCEEIGAKAYLALAPNHIYIKHQDEKGQWTNVELTNGGFPRDQWIIKEMAISVEAIKTGIYMNPLTQKESIAMTMFDLASGYEVQHGVDTFLINMVNTALKYYPKCIPLLQFKANNLDVQIKAERKKYQRDTNQSFLYIKQYQDTVNKIDELGYKDMPAELYSEWVKSVEKEKLKQSLTHK